jgi:DNA-binding transcriptional regulator YdaS (Cro superfamily)
MENAGLTQAIKKAGGQAALARVLARQTGRPIRQGHVWAWIHRSRRVPPELVLAIEIATGVSRHDLRPDIYPRDARSLAN